MISSLHIALLSILLSFSYRVNSVWLSFYSLLYKITCCEISLSVPSVAFTVGNCIGLRLVELRSPHPEIRKIELCNPLRLLLLSSQLGNVFEATFSRTCRIRMFSEVTYEWERL